MKRTLIFLVIFTVTCNCLAAARPQRWHDPDAWNKLTKGATSNDVIRTLGSPVAKETAARVMIYYYQQTPEQGSPKPSVGIVRFKGVADRRTGRTSFTVHDFTLPDWDIIEKIVPKTPELIAAEQKVDQLEAQLERHRAEQERIAERARLARLQEEQRQQQIVALASREQPAVKQTATPSSDGFDVILWIQDNFFLSSVIFSILGLLTALGLAIFTRKPWQ